MSETKIVIQINSLEALNKLINDDPKTLVAIREGIANEFAKRHLKPVIHEILKSEMSAIKDSVNKVFKQILEGDFVVENSVLRWGLYGARLTENVKRAISDQVLKTVQKQVIEETDRFAKSSINDISALVLDGLAKRVQSNIKEIITR